jgi:DNA polymerase V
MYAIVDCNSFYCSCERLFRPDLKNKPVVVLSNNDGCIIARTDEAKQAGIAMGTPYFQVKDLLKEKQVEAFSSNYPLYGEISLRVMDTLRQFIGESNVEVYSVDEAFLQLTDIPFDHLTTVAKQVRDRVEQWTGIPVSVGVGRTKVLAKVANRRAKKNKIKSGCIYVLDTVEKETAVLQETPTGDIWGIGRQYAKSCIDKWALFDANQLRGMSPLWAQKHLGGVVGLRLLQELRGIPSMEWKAPLTQKKMIGTSRMFGHSVSTLTEVKEAIATYTARAAEKLRRQSCAATHLSVYLVPRAEQAKTGHQHASGVYAKRTLPLAVSDTGTLIQAALQLVVGIFEPGQVYKKAGVQLSEIVSEDSIQTNLFGESMGENKKKLMLALDNLNVSMRNDILKFASTGTKRNWKMRQEKRSPRYTTRWEEIRVVH